MGDFMWALIWLIFGMVILILGTFFYVVLAQFLGLGMVVIGLAMLVWEAIMDFKRIEELP